MGSFRPGAGNQHLHWYFNFTGCIVETAPVQIWLAPLKEPEKSTFFGFFFLRVVKNKMDDKVDGVIRLQDHTSTGNVHSG